jgi:membrane-associated phospholipid phosphatase
VLHGVDATGNACPSLHVATAVFTAAWLHRLLGQIGFGAAWRIGNALWVVGIVWSTVAVRQHVVLDVVGGLLLAALFAAPALRWHRRQVGATGEYHADERSHTTGDHDGSAGCRGNNR